MPHAPPDCVVGVWVSVGVFAQISEHASFHVCAVSAGVSVFCVSFTLLPPLPSCSNAVETLTHQTQPHAAWVQGGQKKMAVSKETFLPVIHCMLKLLNLTLHSSCRMSASTLVLPLF